MLKRRIIVLIDKHRVRTAAILALLILMIILYWYQHHEESSPMPLSTMQFHYPFTHEMTLSSVSS